MKKFLVAGKNHHFVQTTVNDSFLWDFAEPKTKTWLVGKWGMLISWEQLPLITLTPPSWPTFLRLHVKSIHRSQCKNPKHSEIHSQYVSSLLRPFPKFFPRCCWNLKISHLTLGFQVEPTFHNFSTLVTPMAGQTTVVCFQSQPRVPPMHKNPFYVHLHYWSRYHQIKDPKFQLYA